MAKRPVTFDAEALRSFVTGIELGSFVLAADRLGRSTSAVSAQLKKLEQQAGTELVQKSGRHLILTERGEVMLSYARRILRLNDEVSAIMLASALSGSLNLGPQLSALNLYPPFSGYCLVPLLASSGLLGGCEFTRQNATPFSEEDKNGLHELCMLAAIAVEQIQLRENALFQQSQLRHERDDFRILVDITNAVLSKLDLDELTGEIAKTIHHFFHINAISIVLCDADKDSEQASVYATHYVQTHVAEREQSRMMLNGSLEQQVMKSGEMLLTNVRPAEEFGSDESTLFQLLWRDQTQTLCILPLRFGHKTLGVLKLGLHWLEQQRCA